MSLSDLLARMLDPAEREAVLGDLAECGDSPGGALQGIAGLVVRRQLERLKHWHPWTAAAQVAVTGALGYFVAEATLPSVRLGWWLFANRRNFDPAALAAAHLSVYRTLPCVVSGLAMLVAIGLNTLSRDKDSRRKEQ